MDVSDRRSLLVVSALVIIKLNWKALRQTRWHAYALRFLLGGLITVLTGAISSKWGPVFGGLFLAFPAIYPASATLLDSHEKEKKRKAGIAVTIRGRLAAALEARGAVMGAIGAIFFAVLAWQALPRWGVLLSLLGALICWSSVSTLLWYLRKHHAAASRSSK